MAKRRETIVGTGLSTDFDDEKPLASGVRKATQINSAFNNIFSSPEMMGFNAGGILGATIGTQVGANPEVSKIFNQKTVKGVETIRDLSTIGNPITQAKLIGQALTDPGSLEEGVRAIPFVGDEIGDFFYGEEETRVGADGGTDANGNPRSYSYDMNSMAQIVKEAYDNGEIIDVEAQYFMDQINKLPHGQGEANSNDFESGIQRIRKNLKKARDGKDFGQNFNVTRKMRQAAQVRARTPGRKQTFLGGR